MPLSLKYYSYNKTFTRYLLLVIFSSFSLVGCKSNPPQSSAKVETSNKEYVAVVILPKQRQPESSFVTKQMVEDIIQGKTRELSQHKLNSEEFRDWWLSIKFSAEVRKSANKLKTSSNKKDKKIAAEKLLESLGDIESYFLAEGSDRAVIFEKLEEICSALGEVSASKKNAFAKVEDIMSGVEFGWASQFLSERVLYWDKRKLENCDKGWN